tara:strand:- start:804 stop:989 length:186 start_codon:yes stop_codon:yes gene_type:complete
MSKIEELKLVLEKAGAVVDEACSAHYASLARHNRICKEYKDADAAFYKAQDAYREELGELR